MRAPALMYPLYHHLRRRAEYIAQRHFGTAYPPSENQAKPEAMSGSRLAWMHLCFGQAYCPVDLVSLPSPAPRVV
jgi:hypothetical protein